MREFFKYVFATVVGIVIATVLLFMLFFVILIGIVSSVGEEKKVIVKNNSILYLNLDQVITERTPENSLAGLPLFGEGDEKTIGFTDIIK
ncbi:MAG: signal peptide peptidase SppA, partial [Chitinophagaceae bacterium]